MAMGADTILNRNADGIVRLPVYKLTVRNSYGRKQKGMHMHSGIGLKFDN